MPDRLSLDGKARSAELLHILTSRIDQAQNDHKALRLAVCAYVSGLQERDAPIEEVTQTVRSILAKADRKLIKPVFAGATDQVEVYARELVNWCVKHGPKGVFAAS
ncbi:MAG: hypothetical protein ABJB95_00210 [Gemmatimonadales bacterium]